MATKSDVCFAIFPLFISGYKFILQNGRNLVKNTLNSHYNDNDNEIKIMLLE